MPHIVEIGEITKQGVTKPILCKADDGMDYVVKGKFAGNRSVVAEWVASSLGKLIGIPIPPFCILDVPQEFFQYGAVEEKLIMLGRGPVFASRYIPEVVELRNSDVEKIDVDLRAKVLAFDLWIANCDRLLAEGGGNPNLLWRDADQKLIVIDHNCAFSPEEMGDFTKLHVFRAAASAWSESFKGNFNTEMTSALTSLKLIWNELPDEWLLDGCGLNQDDIEVLLWKFKNDPVNFWDFLP